MLQSKHRLWGNGRCVSGFSGLPHTPRVVVLAIALAAAPALAQQGGHGEWGKPKPTPAKEDAPKTSRPDDASTPDAERIKAEGRGLFGPGAAPGGSMADTGAKGWAVVVAVFRGEDRDKEAQTLLAKARTEGGLPEAYIAHRNEATMIAVGDFPSPEDERAKAELKRVAEIEVRGIRPYAGAMLAPPMEWKMPGGLPQYNLNSARKAHPDALYTLQVGAYGRLDLKGVPKESDLVDARKAAEEAAATLRREGEEAWYYHGPTMSMVCVGAFDETDFDPQAPTLKSSRLRDTQKRHPYNLYNGQGMRVKVKGRPAEIQPSCLVEIPK